MQTSRKRGRGGACGLDIDASKEATRIVQFCDFFHISLIKLVDVPEFW